ncbi:MAG: hypothetical protein ACHP6I_00230 [Rickettsiales bacterium]
MFGWIADIIRGRIIMSVISLVVTAYLIAYSLGMTDQLAAAISTFISTNLPWIKPALQSVSSFLDQIVGSTPKTN